MKRLHINEVHVPVFDLIVLDTPFGNALNKNSTEDEYELRDGKEVALKALNVTNDIDINDSAYDNL